MLSQEVRSRSWDGNGAGSFPPRQTGLSLTQRVLGWVHPPERAPAEGLVHRLRQRVQLTWQHQGVGKASVSFSESQHSASTEQYSYRFETSLTDSFTGSSWSRSGESRYTWNGRVW